MGTSIILQARMSSRRFPGKVLSKIAGKPLLGYCVERLARVKEADQLIVATSVDISDDPIVAYCHVQGLPCFRGSLHNVAKRFKDLIISYKSTSFVRVCADSPLTDSHMIADGIRLFQKNDEFDLVTNIAPRSYPKGMSFEVVDANVFIENYPRFNRSEHFEHLTKFFYDNPDEFSIRNISNPKGDWSSVNFSIDTAEDFRRIELIMGTMERPHWEYGVEDIMDIYQKVKVQ